MHTVEVLEQAIATAEELGFTVRQDWFAGSAAGACELKGRRWLFIDLALSPAEQLEQVLEAIRGVRDGASEQPTHQLQNLPNLRKAA